MYKDIDWATGAYTCHPKLYESPYMRFKQEELLAVSYIKSLRSHVIEKKFSFMGSFDGRHRSAKSVTAATFGYLWDESFWKYFESRIVQDHHEFMNAMDGIVKQKIYGGVIIVDEAGVSMASTDWYERWMKTLTKTIQMFGMYLPVVLFVAPVKDFVDSRLRKMFHAYYKMDRYNTKETTITPYNLRYNPIKNKWFYRKPIVRIGGQEIVLSRIRFGKPPDEICDRYTALETGRKAVMFEHFMDEMKRSDVKEMREEVDPNRLIEKVVENYQIYQAKRSKPNDIILDENLLEYGLRIRNRMAKYVKLEAERKIRDKQKETAELMAKKE